MIPFYHKAPVSFLERSARLMSQPLDDKIVLVGVSGTVVSVPNNSDNSLKVVGLDGSIFSFAKQKLD